MTLQNIENQQLGLLSGPHWSSFEELRVKHAEKLGEIQPGKFGTLKVKKRNFVIVDQTDFDRFQTVVDEIREMVEQLNVLRHAAAAAEKNQDEATIRMLRATTEMATRTVEKFVDHSLHPFTLETPEA